MIKRRLTNGTHGHDIIASKNSAGGPHGARRRSRVDGHCHARELPEGGAASAARSEQLAVEGGGGGEGRRGGEEGGERERGDGASILVGDDAAEGHVVGGAGVAQLQEAHRGTEAGVAADSGSGSGGGVREVQIEEERHRSSYD